MVVPSSGSEEIEEMGGRAKLGTVRKGKREMVKLKYNAEDAKTAFVGNVKVDL